jgi:F-type H+-transporting ATPase subunit epsilon
MHLEVVTPKGVAFSGEADEVIAPGVEGEFGVLPGHTPFLSALKAGTLTWRKGGEKSSLTVGAGYAEVSGPTRGDKIVVLVQEAKKV